MDNQNRSSTGILAFIGALATFGWHFFAYGTGAVILALWGLATKQVPPYSLILLVIAAAFFVGGFQAWRKERLDYLKSNARFDEATNRPHLTASDPNLGPEYAGAAYDFTMPLINGPTELTNVRAKLTIFFGDRTVEIPALEVGHLGPSQRHNLRLAQIPFPHGIASSLDAVHQSLLMHGTVRLEYTSAINGARYQKVEYFDREITGTLRITTREAPRLISQSES